MRKRIIRPGLLTALLVLFGGCADGVVSPAPDADGRLKLSTPRAEYLLGEPVVLNLSLHNPSDQPIEVHQVFIRQGLYEAAPWLSRAGEPFEEFQPAATVIKAERRFLPIKPKGALDYQYRVVAAPWPRCRLAFPTPGLYRIYVVYPLGIRGQKVNGRIASNVVEVRIKEPTGEDARVWKRLNDPSFLTLLQLERVDERTQAVPLKMADVLVDFPKSGYAPALRRALAKVYFQGVLLEAKDRARLAQVLGITHVETLADERLEVRREKALPDEIPLQEALESLSTLGVPLTAAPILEERKVTVEFGYNTLRRAMGRLSQILEASWERRDDGYLLVPFQPDAAARQDKR